MKTFEETILISSKENEKLTSIEKTSISIKDSSIIIDEKNMLEIGMGKNEVFIFAEIESFLNIKNINLSKVLITKNSDYSKIKLSEKKKSLLILLDKKSFLNLTYKVIDLDAEKALEFDNPDEVFEKLNNITDKTEKIISFLLGSTEEELENLIKSQKEYVIAISVV